MEVRLGGLVKIGSKYAEKEGYTDIVGTITTVDEISLLIHPLEVLVLVEGDYRRIHLADAIVIEEKMVFQGDCKPESVYLAMSSGCQEIVYLTLGRYPKVGEYVTVNVCRPAKPGKGVADTQEDYEKYGIEVIPVSVQRVA